MTQKGRETCSRCEPQEVRQPSNQKLNDQDTRDDINTLSLQKDEQMVVLGLNILASEFDNLMSYFKTISILREKQRSQKRIEESHHPKKHQLQPNQTPESVQQKEIAMKPNSSSKSLMVVKQTQKKIYSGKEKQHTTTTQSSKQTKATKLKQMKKKGHQVQQQKLQQR